ncbi:LysR family transcriptional regulator substrate-binding protein [Lactobacillus delbrueckii]
MVFASGYLNGQTLSGRLIPQFQKNHPKAQISFREINDYQQIPAEVDILEMTYAKEPLSEHEFSFISIVPSPLRVALPASHPLAKKKQLSLQDLAAQDLEIVAPSIAGSEDVMLSKLLNVRPAVKLHYYSVFNKAVVNQAQLTKHLLLIPEAYSELCHP